MALEIKRPERLVEICLDGTLVAEYEALEAELEDARRNALSDRRMNSPVNKLEERKAELYKAQEEDTIVFKIRALPRGKWSEVIDENPPRKGNVADENLGYDIDAGTNAVMATEGTIVEVTKLGEPIEFTADDWARISPDLSDGQWQEFQNAVMSANVSKPRVPFSQSGFKLMQDSAKNSK